MSFLSLKSQEITVPSSNSTLQPKKKSVVGPVVGGVIGGLAIMICVVGAFLWRRRATRPSSMQNKTDKVENEPMTVPYDYNPFTEMSQNPMPSQSSLPLPAVPNQSGVILSVKAREAAGYLNHRTPPSTLDSDPTSTSAEFRRPAPASGRAPSSETPRVSTSDVSGLRHEVENLRQAMQELQAERLGAPPGYHDIQAQGSNPLDTP